MKCLVLFLVFVIGDALGGVPGGANQLTDAGELNDLRVKIESHLKTLSGKPNHTHLEYVGHSSATYQVVSGKIYNVKARVKENEQVIECIITLLEKPWLHFEKLTANCGGQHKRTYESVVGVERRRKRSISFGGLQEVPEEEWPELHKKMQSAFTKLGAKHTNFGYDYMNIVEATKQTVAGSSFKVKVLVKSKKSNDTTKVCEVAIWEKLWEHFEQIEFECEEVKYEYTSTPATSTPAA